jgi:hypothetical protein
MQCVKDRLLLELNKFLPRLSAIALGLISCSHRFRVNLTGWSFVARHGSCSLRLRRFASSTSRPATATLQGTIAPLCSSYLLLLANFFRSMLASAVSWSSSRVLLCFPYT